MFEKLNLQSKNTNEKKSHLNEGIKPIYVSLMSTYPSEFNVYTFVDIYNVVDEFKDDLRTHNINWADKEVNLDSKKYLHAGLQSYVISSIDEDRKFSKGFHACTGLVVVGVDKNIGKNISFITHQFPIALSNEDKKVKFLSDLNTKLMEMRDRCIPGTVDAVVVGGSYVKDKESDDYPMVLKYYPMSVDLSSDGVRNIFGFEPMIVNGPKDSRFLNGELNEDSIYFDTNQRRLYFVRSKINQPGKGRTSGDFKAGEFEDRKTDWE